MYSRTPPPSTKIPSRRRLLHQRAGTSMDEKDVVLYTALVEGYSKTEEIVESSLDVYKTIQ